MSAKINICKEKQNMIACNLCDYMCKYNIQLRKHLWPIHIMEQKYNCKENVISLKIIWLKHRSTV